MSIRVLALLLASLTAASAQGAAWSPPVHGEYPYASEPQVQYPRQDGRAEKKCSKGQKVWQGRCRPVREIVR